MVKSRNFLTTLIALFGAISFTAGANAAIQNVIPVSDSYMVAEVDTSSAAAKHESFKAINTMIEPAAGDVDEHAKSMHDSHHAEVSDHKDHSADHAHDDHHHGDAYHGDDHGSGGLPQFDPTWFPSQIFWLAIAFLVSYIFFAKKALPDVASSLDARENRIKTDLESADKINAQAEDVRSEYELTLQDARDKSTEIIAGAQEDIKEKSNAALDAFRSNQNKLMADLETKVEEAKTSILDEMKEVAADTARDAAAKIIDVDTDIKAAKSVVEKINKAA